MSNEEIRVGQRWRSRDKRDQGKIVTVIHTTETRAVVQGFIRTSVSHRTLRTRYRLVVGAS